MDPKEHSFPQQLQLKQKATFKLTVPGIYVVWVIRFQWVLRELTVNHGSHGVGRLAKLVLQLEAAVSTVFSPMTPDWVTARSCGDDDDHGDDHSDATDDGNDDGDHDNDEDSG